MLIRPATPSDFDALGQIMFDAIHQGTSPYSEVERCAWLPTVPTGNTWHNRLASQIVIMAEAPAPVGFMTLDASGYVDLAFILHSARGTGVFGALYDQIETEARARGFVRLSTHASLLAQGPFAAMGFELLRHEHVTRGAETLARAEMVKTL